MSIVASNNFGNTSHAPPLGKKHLFNYLNWMESIQWIVFLKTYCLNFLRHNSNSLIFSDTNCRMWSVAIADWYFRSWYSSKNFIKLHNVVNVVCILVSQDISPSRSKSSEAFKRRRSRNEPFLFDSCTTCRNKSDRLLLNLIEKNDWIV